MNGERCQITISSDCSPVGLAALLMTEVAITPPLLAWAEPDLMAAVLDNDTGRRSDFHALVSGTPDWPLDLPLVEARLFWKTAALHVVADETGCRFARIKEEGSADAIRRVYPIHTLQDRRRFGLADFGGGIGRLNAVEYWRDGRLIGWRLMPGGD